MTKTIQAFRAYLATVVSPATVDQYTGCVVRAHRDYDDLLGVLSSEGLSKGRRATYKKALTHFAIHTEDTELAARLQAFVLPGKGRKRLKEKVVPSQKQWRELRHEILGVRDPDLRATLYLLATLGLRIERELLMLTREHLQTALDEGAALLEQKGGTWRHLVLSTDRQQMLARHLAERLSTKPLWTLFLTQRRTKKKSVAEYIRRELRQVGEGLGIEVTPHTLRHAFLDAVYDNTGGNLELVREAAGHASVRTTRQYYQDRGHPETMSRVTRDAVGED